MLTGRALGDVVYGLSCMEDFRRAHPKDRIEVAADARFRELVEGYGQFDEYHFLEGCSREYRALEALLMSPAYAGKAFARRIVCTVPMVADPYARKSGQTALAIVRGLYGLAGAGQITYPAFPKGEIRVIPGLAGEGILHPPSFTEKENSLSTGRSQGRSRIAVVSPYSVSLACSEMGIFEEIASFLKGEGWTVYTNVLKGQKELPGTRRLECSIGELYRIAAGLPLVVSIRSGLLDYVIGSGCPIFAIYLFQYRHLKRHMETMRRFERMFDLAAWKTGDYRQCIYENQDQAMEAFLAYYKEFNG